MPACVKCPLPSEGTWRSQLTHWGKRISSAPVWPSFLRTNCSLCLLLTCAELGATGSVWSWHSSSSSAGLCPHRVCKSSLTRGAVFREAVGHWLCQHRCPDPHPCPWQEALHQRHDPLTSPVQSGSHPNRECLEKWLGHPVGTSQELAGRWQVTYG